MEVGMLLLSILGIFVAFYIGVGGIQGWREHSLEMRRLAAQRRQLDEEAARMGFPSEWLDPS